MAQASLELELRAATLDDAALAADLDTAREPQDPRDPVLMRHWWTDWDANERVGRWISVRDGAAMALVTAGHRNGDRFGWIRPRLHPDVWTEERFAGLIKVGERWLSHEGAATSVFRCRDFMARELDVAMRLGYSEVRRGRISELDLEARRDHVTTTARQTREQMSAQGIDLMPYSEFRAPGRAERLYRLETETEQDIPTTVPVPVLRFEDWKGRRFRDPAVRPERIWVAVESGELVGISQLGFPVTRGVPYTDYTATARAVRGRGIARALKYQTMAQALELGFTRVRTQNDAENTPILHINREMGYRLIIEEIELHRELSA